MGWPNHREVPVVERRDVQNGEAFRDGDHGSVSGSEREVAVLEDKISHPAVVMWGHADLGDYGRRNQQPPARQMKAGEELGTSMMVGIV